MRFGNRLGSDGSFVSLESIIERWTYCYHVTAVVNLRLIRCLRVLHPASTLFQQMNRSDLLNCRRTQDVRLEYQDQEILVRNQIPLDPDSIDLRPTERFEDYVAHLNGHVYFWPGTASGPTPDGVRMFQNAGVESFLIRVPTRSLIEMNDRSRLYLSTCNTGASWIAEGVKKSQRGSGVFRRAESFPDSPEGVEEISFRCSVNFPDDAECSTGIGERWHSLFVQTHGQQRTDTITLRDARLKTLPDVLGRPSKRDSW
jgi:hypothetical protein